MSDTLRHCTLRLRFAVLGAMAECHPPVLLNKLTSVFCNAGMPLAMGNEKRPRPIARLAYPLPPGVEGMQEWADVTLDAGLSDPMDVVTARLKSCCPEGLEILGAEQIPHFASPVDELCETAHWRWFCPDLLFHAARSKIGAFANSESFQITKTGKVGGKKGAKSAEVRHLVQELRWDGASLSFSTRIVQGQALNPLKVLAAILDVEPGQLGVFRRERIDFKADHKISRSDKYAHKLRNLYEDAVLLESSPNIRVYHDDDDEVIYQAASYPD